MSEDSDSDSDSSTDDESSLHTELQDQQRKRQKRRPRRRQRLDGVSVDDVTALSTNVENHGKGRQRLNGVSMDDVSANIENHGVSPSLPCHSSIHASDFPSCGLVGPQSQVHTDPSAEPGTLASSLRGFPGPATDMEDGEPQTVAFPGPEAIPEGHAAGSVMLVHATVEPQPMTSSQRS